MYIIYYHDYLDIFVVYLNYKNKYEHFILKN